MKKFLAMLLALVLALGLTTMAWAEDAKGTAGNPYMLDEFNALQTIPEGTTAVYLNIGEVSLASGDVTIGNQDIRDIWTWDQDTSHQVGDVLEDGRKVYMVRESDTIYNSNKAGFTLYVTGSVNNTAVGGDVNASAYALCLSIPDNCDVVFTKDFTVNGFFRLVAGVQEGKNLGGAVYKHNVNSVLFDHSTFNGIWIQNFSGHIPECDGLGAKELTFDGCTFNAYTNVSSPNDSNPLWFCCTRNCDITIKNCNFKASRPIKLAEQRASGVSLTIVNNTFDMSATNSANEEGKPKNVAIMFCNIGTGALGDVKISDNKVENGAALIAFQSKEGFAMADGAAFDVANNELGAGVKESVVWKSTEEFAPEFVEITPYTPEPTPPRYYYNSTTTTDTKADGTKGSPKTFDAGVGIYALTAVLSVTGMACVGKKKF